MTSRLPSVALLVPCHNAAEFLPRLWETVRAQSVPFAEFFVYDDASTDDTSVVARSLGATVIRGETNRGPGAARNALIAATSCPWVHFHDADDLLHPEFVAHMTARAARDDADVVLCQVDWKDEKSGETVLRWRYDEHNYQGTAAPADMLVNIIGGIGGLYCTEKIRASGGFREGLRYWEDLDFHLRLWRSGARIRVVEEVLSVACRRDSSTSNANLVTVWRVKTDLLSGYLDDPVLRPLVTAAVGHEAERIISRQLALKDHGGARLTLALAARTGVTLPSTSSRTLRLIRRVFGLWTAIRIQHKVRSFAHGK